jgi:mevalonate kinase
MSKIVCTSSPGKISLFGEYNWLIGEAIVMAVNNLRTYVNVQESQINQHIFYSYNINNKKIVSNLSLKEYNGEWEDYLKAAINIVQKHYRIKIPFIYIQVFSQIPLASGLSSSTSFVVAAIGAIAQFCGLPLKKEQLAHFAYLVEHGELSIPCGQMDHYGCTFGGIVYINNSSSPVKSFERYIPNKGLSLLIADTKIQKHTKELIQKLKKRVADNDHRIKPHVVMQRKLIKQARREFQTNIYNFERVGTWLNECQKSFNNNLEVSNILFEQLCSSAIENGAYGAKITGGGTGGCMYAISSSKNEERVKEALQRFGVDVYVTSFDEEGFRFEKKIPI